MLRAPVDQGAIRLPIERRLRQNERVDVSDVLGRFLQQSDDIVDNRSATAWCRGGRLQPLLSDDEEPPIRSLLAFSVAVAVIRIDVTRLEAVRLDPVRKGDDDDVQRLLVGLRCARLPQPSDFRGAARRYESEIVAHRPHRAADTRGSRLRQDARHVGAG